MSKRDEREYVVTYANGGGYALVKGSLLVGEGGTLIFYKEDVVQLVVSPTQWEFVKLEEEENVGA